MKIKESTLSNGLEVLLIDTQSTSLTTILLVGAGSRYETKKNNGIAHFFEHMAFKGSKKYPNSFIISSTIEGIGGVFNAFTSKDHTGYWIKSTSKHFPQVIDVLSDMVLQPLLLDDEIEQEKKVVIEEINMYEDTPQRKINDIFDRLLYQDHPLGMEIVGTKKTVSSFNKKTLLSYINSFYYPKNSVLVLAGGLNADLKSYLSIIEDKFSSWKNPKNIKNSVIKVKEDQKKPEILVKNKKTEQAHFILGYRTFSFFDKRKIALKLLSVILGQGMSSRLFIEVRERRGLCYYIFSSVEHYFDCGSFLTQAGVANQKEKIKEAISIILKEHEKIKKDIKEDEIKKAKEMIKGRLLLSLESSDQVAVGFGTKKLLEKKIETVDEIIKKIDKVKKEELISLAREIFVEKNLNFALIGPYQNQDFLHL